MRTPQRGKRDLQRGLRDPKRDLRGTPRATMLVFSTLYGTPVGGPGHSKTGFFLAISLNQQFKCNAVEPGAHPCGRTYHHQDTARTRVSASNSPYLVILGSSGILRAIVRPRVVEIPSQKQLYRPRRETFFCFIRKFTFF